jgi:hypothetical protein
MLSGRKYPRKCLLDRTLRASSSGCEKKKGGSEGGTEGRTGGSKPGRTEGSKRGRTEGRKTGHIKMIYIYYTKKGRKVEGRKEGRKEEGRKVV